jgi:hypothetical protein
MLLVATANVNWSLLSTSNSVVRLGIVSHNLQGFRSDATGQYLVHALRDGVMGRLRCSWLSSSQSAHLDQKLAEVAPLQHPDEGLWSIFQTGNDILTIFDPARSDFGRELLDEFIVLESDEFPPVGCP